MFMLYLSLVSTDSERAYVASLYHKLNRRLLGYAYKLSGDVSWAQDATQQVYLIAIDKIEIFTQMDDDETAAYCFTIVKNLYIRKRVADGRQVHLESMDDLHTAYATDSRVEEEVLNRMDFEEVKRAVSKLPERKRMVIALKYGFGLSHSEISRSMGISTSSSQNLLAAAIRQLRDLLKEGLSYEAK